MMKLIRKIKSKYDLHREQKLFERHNHIWEEDFSRWGYSCRFMCCDAFISAEFAKRVGIIGDYRN